VHRWGGNIKVDFKERCWEGVYWIYLVQSSDQWEALVDTVMNFWVP
jgi:hypothetical protein